MCQLLSSKLLAMSMSNVEEKEAVLMGAAKGEEEVVLVVIVSMVEVESASCKLTSLLPNNTQPDESSRKAQLSAERSWSSAGVLRSGKRSSCSERERESAWRHCHCSLLSLMMM